MAQMKVPTISDDDIYTTQYKTLLGVDFQKDVTDVDKNHSPNMVNMISDLGGNPIKRDGYRAVQENTSKSSYPSDKYIYFVSVMGQMYGIKRRMVSDSASTTYNDEIVIAKVQFAESKVEEISVSAVIPIEGDTGTGHGDTTEYIKIKKCFASGRYIYIFSNVYFIRFDTVLNTHIITGLNSSMMSTGIVGMSSPISEDLIPLTTISITDVENGNGGVSYYGKNLCSVYQKCSYVLSNPNDGSTQTAKTFKIPNYSKITTWLKVEVMNSNGVWEETTDYTVGSTTNVYGTWLFGHGGRSSLQYTIIDPIITFNTAPSWNPITGQDSVRITFVPFSMDVYETIDEKIIYRGVYNDSFVKLFQSDAFGTYNSRLFIGVDNKAYYSEASNAFMIPDNNYFEVDNQIEAFTSISSNLGVITNGSGTNTIYIATESTTTIDSTSGEEETAYSLKPSNSGMGAVNGSCIGRLNDEPLFLTKTGVYGILTNYLSDKYAVGRSARINRQLCKETNLEKAVGITYNGYFYIAVNGNMYVLDGRHKDSTRGNDTSYECYYFDSIPIITNMFVANDVMFFTDGEKIYRWNDDLAEYSKYYDNAYQATVTAVEYNSSETNVMPTANWDTRANVLARTSTDNTNYWTRVTYDNNETDIYDYLIDESGEPEIGSLKWTGDIVKCKWCSSFDDDGAPQKLKILNKKGTMITLVPHAQSSVELTLIKDGDDYHYLGIFESDMSNFERIDLSKFTFKSNAVASDVFTRKKVKKYKRLQFVLENNRAEPFGITNIIKTYTFGNYAKR